MLLRLAIIGILFGCALQQPWVDDVSSNAPPPPLRVAVLDFGKSELGRRAADIFSASLAKESSLRIVDRALSRSAALGMGYSGSLNMALGEARDLGAGIGCDFFIVGDAQVQRRSPSDNSVYYEAYASVFVVSARTGQLVMWSRPNTRAATPAVAEQSLLKELTRDLDVYSVAAYRRAQDERTTAERAAAGEAIVYEEAPDEGSPAAANFRPPEPYRRVRPPYPDTASEAEAEATVDAQVEIGADGEVARIEIVRWAGFGLDESVVNTVRQMHFRPAMRDGASVPVRVLLRYNFRRPPKTK